MNEADTTDTPTPGRPFDPRPPRSTVDQLHADVRDYGRQTGHIASTQEVHTRQLARVLKTLGQHGTHFTNINKRLAGLDTRLAGLDTRLTSLETRLQQGLETFTTHLESLATCLEALTTRLRRLEEKVEVVLERMEGKVDVVLERLEVREVE